MTSTAARPSSDSTLAPRIEAAADRGGTITFVTGASDGPGYSSEELSWAQLHDEARSVAAALQTRGVGPGTTVGILGPTSRELITAIQATWLAGATVAMLPLPMRLGSIEEFVDATRRRIAAAHATTVLIDPALADFVPADIVATTFADLLAVAPADRFSMPTVDPESLAILQFTSGSTADPKGVMLPHRCVTANIDSIRSGAAFGGDDERVASWLPLYHDMGLIGLLGVPMTTGVDLVIAGPQDFLAAPARWLDWMSTFRATVTGGPNFAYALAARALRRASDLDLSRWRLALNGAEPIDPDSVEAFLDAGAGFGLRPGTAFCVYGMAEATLAISFPEPGTGMTTDTVDRRVLETDAYAAPVAGGDGARRLPRLGPVLDGLELQVVDAETGARRTEREVGEIELRGNSITPGYFRSPDATAAAFRDGWLRTGDLGYLVDGEVVICGRRKDVIIVGGRNVFPEDIERAVASVDGVRAGNVIAFGTTGRRGREAIVVVAETRAEDAGTDPVRSEVAARVTDAIGIPPTEIVLVAPGTLPKTSSGKLQRSLCKDRYLSDILEPV
ncbi:MAG: long-chain-fatty-acid--CoA ligase [Acidimicrobiia bacterium]